MEDEYHCIVCSFPLVCKAYANFRKEQLPKKYSHVCQPNYNKFNVLMASENDSTAKSLALILCSAFKLRKVLVCAWRITETGFHELV